MPLKRRITIAFTILAVAFVTGLTAMYMARNDGLTRAGSGTALVGGPFEMTDQDGRRVTEKDFLGRYMLVFFGFTYCPDVCPSELQVMSAALDEMGADADPIQPVFVSIDPARDTPAVVKEYVGNFHPRMKGLTGSEADVAKIASAYRVYYAKQQSKAGSSDYLMDHSAILYLMGPDGKFVKHFSYGTDVKALALGLRDALRK